MIACGRVGRARDQAPATKHASARESGQDLGVSQPLRLLVDTRLHSEELARFETNVVRGPYRDDCAIWVGAIGGDGYGRFWVRRGGGERIMVRADRYALAAARDGRRWNRRCAHCTGATTQFAYGSACRGSRVCCT